MRDRDLAFAHACCGWPGRSPVWLIENAPTRGLDGRRRAGPRRGTGGACREGGRAGSCRHEGNGTSPLEALAGASVRAGVRPHGRGAARARRAAGRRPGRRAADGQDRGPGTAARGQGGRREVGDGQAAESGMNGDALAELLRALVELQQAEDASARAAWALAEAEEADPVLPAEVEQARERYEAAVAAVEAARACRREIEAVLPGRGGAGPRHVAGPRPWLSRAPPAR